MFRLFTALCLSLMAVAFVAPATAQPDADAPDLQAMIDRAIADGDAKLVIPPGTYRVAPPAPRAPHLTIANATELTIVADGVRMVCTQLNQAIRIENADGLTLRGLTIDHDPLPFTQGTVTAVSDDHRVLTIELDKGYPALTERARASIWTPDGTRIKPDTWTRYGGSFEHLDDGSVRFDQGRSMNDGVAAGDRIVFSNQYTTAHGIVLDDCSNTTLDGVTLHASTCFGVLERHGDANRYANLRITPGPPPAGADRPRILSTLADGLHSKHARRGPTVEGCVFEKMGDDGIAINGDFMLLTGADASATTPSVTLAFKRFLSVDPGDRLLVRDKFTGRPLGEATVTAIEPATGDAVAQLGQLVATHLPQLRERNAFDQAWTLSLDQPIDAPVGSVAVSPDRIGAGFVVRDNTIRNHRARGILVKSSDGVIQNNTIVGSSMAGIVMSPEVDLWMEADFSRDVVIRGNTIEDVNLAARNAGSVYAGAISITSSTLSPAGGHERLRVVDNTITGGAGPGLLVTSARDVEVRGNRFVGTHQRPGAHGAGHGIAPEPVMQFINVDELTVEDNAVESPGPHAGARESRAQRP